MIVRPHLFKRSLLREAPVYVSSILSGIFVFWLLLPLSVLDPRKIAWLYTNEPSKLDIAQTVTAQNAYLASPWTFPPGSLRALGGWGNNSLIFSDALPLTLIPIKMMNEIFSFHSVPLQFFGINAFLAIVVFMIVTTKYIFWETKSLYIAIIGSVLIATLPQMFMNWGWPSLLFQCYIVASIYLFRKSSGIRKLERKKWLLLVFVASMTHSYFVPFVSAFFLADLFFNNTLRLKGRVVEFMYFLLPILTGTFLAGGFNAGLRGSATGADSVGLFSSDAFTYFNAGDISFFVKGIPTVTKLTGFSYIGMAIFVIAFLSLSLPMILKDSFVQSRLQFKKNIESSDFLSYKRLFFIGILFFLISIGPAVTILGEDHFFTKNRVLLAPFSIFRVHARFAWALPIIVILFAVFVFSKNFGNRVTAIILSLALFVQFSEFHVYYTNQRNAITTFVETKPESPTFSDLNLVPNVSMYFVPGFPAPDKLPWRTFLIEFISKGGISENFAYMNRYSTDRVGKANQRIMELLQSGRIPSNSYVMIREDFLPELRQPFTKIARIQDWELIFLKKNDD
jgi:hypothetical protein